MPAAQIGYEEGRARQLDALGATVERMQGSPDPFDGVGEIALVGIGASFAALATPLHVLRAAGRAVWRSDCSDLPVVSDPRPGALIALSQGGRSVETNAVVERFTAAGVRTLAITNANESPLAAAAADAIRLGGGADSRVSTVGFVTTYTAVAMLAERSAGITPGIGWDVLPEIIERALAEAAPVLRAFADEKLAHGSVDVVAAADQLTAAEASALLLREGPLVPSAAYGTRAYLHGPMDAAGEGVAHVVIGGARERQLVEQLEERASATLFLAEALHLRGDAPFEVAVPAGLTDGQRALVTVCLLQQLVSETARVRGNAVDEAVFVRQDTKLALT